MVEICLAVFQGVNVPLQILWTPNLLRKAALGHFPACPRNSQQLHIISQIKFCTWQGFYKCCFPAVKGICSRKALTVIRCYPYSSGNISPCLHFYCFPLIQDSFNLWWVGVFFPSHNTIFTSWEPVFTVVYKSLKMSVINFKISFITIWLVN